MSLAEKFIDEIRTWIGTPYVTKGCKPGPRGGTTCGHYFLQCMMKILPHGVELDYAMEHQHRLIILGKLDVITPAFDVVADEVPLEEMKRGDVPIIMFYNVPMQPIVYLGKGQFIYCTRAMGVLEGPLPSNLMKRIVRVYRWKED